MIQFYTMNLSCYQKHLLMMPAVTEKNNSFGLSRHSSYTFTKCFQHLHFTAFL